MAGLVMDLLMLGICFSTVVTDIAWQPGNTPYAAAFCKHARYPLAGAGLQSFILVVLHKGFTAMPAQVALVASLCTPILYAYRFITNTSGTLNGLLLHFIPTESGFWRKTKWYNTGG
jgi:hypothetical protein